MLYPMQLIPATKSYIWGGTRLKTEWNKPASSDVVAESWELACHPDGESVVLNGEFAARTLRDVLSEHPEFLGKKAQKFPYFPLLVKLIDAEQNLSIQVHPDDAYAMEHEKQFGKTEMWYIVDARPGSGVYCGFRKPLTTEEVRAHLANGTITDVLQFLPVRKGDCVYLPAGTVHAICGGLLICEIQQNSAVTYRLYDYDRKDKDGKPRALHIEQALPVIRSGEVHTVNESVHVVDDTTRVLAQCDYFTVHEYIVAGEREIAVDADSFVSLTVTEGEGSVFLGDVRANCKRGHTVFLPANSGKVILRGAMTVIAARV